MGREAPVEFELCPHCQSHRLFFLNGYQGCYRCSYKGHGIKYIQNSAAQEYLARLESFKCKNHEGIEAKGIFCCLCGKPFATIIRKEKIEQPDPEFTSPSQGPVGADVS